MPVEQVMDEFDQIGIPLPDNLLKSRLAQVNRALFVVVTGPLSLRLDAVISRAHRSTTRGETCSTRDDARHDDDCA